MNKYPRTFGDIDHDHKADLIGFGYYGTYVAYSSGSNFGYAKLKIR